MHLKFEQRLIYENRQLKTEIWRWKLACFVLVVCILAMFAKRASASEFSTVTLCSHPVGKLFVGSEHEQERQAEIQWREEGFRTQVCESLPLLGKVPYGLKYKTDGWEFSFKLFLRR